MLEQKLAIVTASDRCDNMAALARRQDPDVSALPGRTRRHGDVSIERSRTLALSGVSDR